MEQFVCFLFYAKENVCEFKRAKVRNGICDPDAKFGGGGGITSNPI